MGTPLERDMDFIRSLLLDIEGGRRVFETLGDDVADALGIDPVETMPAEQAERLAYNLGLWKTRGLLNFTRTWAVLRV